MRTHRAARIALLAGTALLGTAGSAAAAAMQISLDRLGLASSNTQLMAATAGRTGVTVIAEATDELPGWRLDIAPPVGQRLQVGRIYEGMVRAGQQTATVGGLLVLRDGFTCGVVEGRVAIKALTIGAAGRVTRLSATIVQRCDGSPAASGGVSVTLPAEPPVLRLAQPRGSVFAGGEVGEPGSPSYALGLTVGEHARLRRGGADTPLFEARGGRSFAGDVDARHVVWQTTRGRGPAEVSRIAVARLGSRARPRLIGKTGWRWSPVVDGRYLAYNRGAGAAARKQIVVTGIDGGRERVVARAVGRRNLLRVAGLGGGTLTYERCTGGASDCFTYLLPLGAAGATATRLRPPPRSVGVYSADVAPDGSIFAVASRRGCGAAARIVHWVRGEGYETIATLPPHVDALDLSVNEVDGSIRLLFTSYDCARRNGDASVIVLPARRSPPPAPEQTTP